MTRNTVRLFILAAIAAMTSCSSNSVLGEQSSDMEETGTPMRFSSPAVGTMESRTRASERLTTGFLVSAYKNYGAATQQEVMHQYEAIYHQDNWNTTNSSWNTVGTTADGFYQEQFEKYWDASAYPYGFLAIAPAPIADGAVKEGFEVNSGSVKIPASITGQTVTDGKYSPASPFDGGTEYLISQMQRKHKDGDATQTEDIDELTTTTIGGNTSPTGKVPLPFHHLTSKVRFAIYTTEPVSESQTLPISNVSFKVKSSEDGGFVQSCGGYSATISSTTNALSGTFSDVKKSTDAVELLTLSGPTDKITDAYLEKHEWKSKEDVNAYFFECKEGLAQVPQRKVKLTVSFTITPTTGEPLTVTDMPLTLTDADGNEISEFTWQPNHLYTYYIVVRKLFNYEISFTATVSDWEDINGNIATNLED